MREIGKSLNETKTRVEMLAGIPLIIKLNEGRGRLSLFACTIEKLYPSIFSVRLDDGTLRSFSYSDVQTSKIRFLKKFPS